MVIGVLAIQGSIEEHLAQLSQIKKVKAIQVENVEDLDMCDGLIIPGGESTTLGLMMRTFGLAEAVYRRVTKGMPVWGTCAGLILLANEIEGELPYMPVLDITVKRNGYGRQLDSFYQEGDFTGVGYIGMVFIRAPKITRTGLNVTTLAECNGDPVAVRKDNILGTTFHPELVAGDPRVHRYFVQMVESALKASEVK